MIKAVFFDLDGTLIDAEKAHVQATSLAFAHFGYDYEKIRTKTPHHVSAGKRVMDNLKARKEGAGITELQLPLHKLCAVREHIFLELAQQTGVVLPGAELVMHALRKRKLILAIVSSGTAKYIERIMQQYHWSSLIDFVVTGDEVQVGKPSPECYLRAYQKALQRDDTLQHAECLVFEDTEAGVTAAKAVGMKVVLVPSSNSAPPSELLPDYTYQSLTQFDPHILT